MFKVTFTATHRLTSLVISDAEYVSARTEVEARHLITNLLVARGMTFINFGYVAKVGH